MRIDELYKTRKPGISFEIFPPKRDSYLKDIEPVVEILADLKPDYISITFGAGGSVADNRTMDIARLIKDKYHVEPMVHMTCLNYSRDEIDVVAREMEEYGIENVLALRGDRREGFPEKKDFRYANELTEYLVSKGHDFCIAGGCYPEGHLECLDKKTDIVNLKKKVDAGDTLLISQLFFDNGFFYDFVSRARETGIGVTITPGIMPVINKAQIERMTPTCGASLPPRFRKIMERYGDNKDALFDAGMSYLVSQAVDLMASGSEGIHLYSMNRADVARRLVDSLKNLV
ncbi:MAG: methylenetetrahydrofolate reductase [Lachnospiraceae bacterium]|nr:methylenetetrahydrofolate reductase [Lachnospiraceae bacterium]